MDIVFVKRGELLKLISGIVSENLEQALKPILNEVKKDRLSDSRRVSRKEAAHIEGISLTTLDKLSREGKYTKIKVGGKTLFDLDNKGRVI